MARFPRTEPRIPVLAHDMAAGLNANGAISPSPPVALADLQADLATYITARNAAIAAQAIVAELDNSVVRQSQHGQH